MPKASNDSFENILWMTFPEVLLCKPSDNPGGGWITNGTAGTLSIWCITNGPSKGRVMVTWVKNIGMVTGLNCLIGGGMPIYQNGSVVTFKTLSNHELSKRLLKTIYRLDFQSLQQANTFVFVWNDAPKTADKQYGKEETRLHKKDNAEGNDRKAGTIKEDSLPFVQSYHEEDSDEEIIVIVPRKHRVSFAPDVKPACDEQDQHAATSTPSKSDSDDESHTSSTFDSPTRSQLETPLSQNHYASFGIEHHLF